MVTLTKTKFNPHDSRTADGKIITLGLIVFTNEMEVGRVIGDTHTCCANHGAPAAQMQAEGAYFTDHEHAPDPTVCYCRHDHWFEVEALADTDGTEVHTRSMNGERLSTIFRSYGGTVERARAQAPEWFLYPHNWTLGGRGICANGNCITLGTGEPENDGPCTQHPDYPQEV